MNNVLIIIATVLISGIIFIPIGIIIRKKIAESKIGGAENEANRLLEVAKKDAENIKREELFKAKEEIMQEKEEFEKEIRERRGELQSQEKRLIQKEENLEKRATNFEHKEKEIERKMQDVEEKRKEAQEVLDSQITELQRISGLTTDEAKNMILTEVEKEVTAEKANIIKEMDSKIKEEAAKNAKEILTYTIQKCAADHTSETTVSIVALPSDEMKGRIIGREGRNIKALETLTGIDLIIDDTPEAVVLSGFDPLRREVAKVALEKLIEDGRIHPAKIEEMVEKAKEAIAETIKSEGERATLETGVIGLNAELIKLIRKIEI